MNLYAPTKEGIQELFNEVDSGDFYAYREEKANALWEILSLKEKIEALEKLGFDMEEPQS